jgi:hypothetical protein
MPQIANDSAGAAHKNHGRADRLRARGVCPHDLAACRLALRCVLGRADACAVLLANVQRSCGVCKEARGGRCAFVCFRRDGYIHTGRMGNDG